MKTTKRFLLVLIFTFLLAGSAWGADLTCCAAGCDGTIANFNAGDAPFDVLDGDTVTFTDNPIVNSDKTEPVLIVPDGGASEATKVIIDLNGNTLSAEVTISTWTDEGNGVYSQTITDWIGGMYEDDIHLKKSTTGIQDGGDNQALLTDSGESWTPDAFIGFTVFNITDVSKGEITDNAGTTVTATLAGGTDNDWDDGDEAIIMDSNFSYDASEDILLYAPTSGAPGDHTLHFTGQDGIRLWAKSYVEIRNGTIQYTNEGVDMATSGGHHDLVNLNFRYITGNALDLADQDSGDVDVTNCTVFWADSGFYYHSTTGDGNAVTNCTASYLNYNGSWSGDGHAVGVQQCEVDISGGYFHHCKKAISFWSNDAGDIATGSVNGVRIANGKGGTGYTLARDGAGVIFSNAADNATIGITVTNCLISDCTVGIYGLRDCDTDPNLIYNNTFYDNDKGTLFVTSADYYEFKNNIFLDNTIHHYWHDGTQVGDNNVADYNDYSPDGNSCFYYQNAVALPNFAAWQVADSQDSNGFIADPLFRNAAAGTAEGFRLTRDSPCRDKGANLAGTIDDDYWGHGRPQGAGYDIGMDEIIKRSDNLLGPGRMI